MKNRRKKPIKNYWAITISDNSGSKYFSARHVAKRNFIIVSVAILVFVFTSFGANIFRSGTFFSLTFENEYLSKENAKFDSVVSKLQQVVRNNEQEVANINKEISRIEKFSGMGTANLVFSLEQRVKLIRDFYDAREEKHAEIGNRINQIEKIIGINEKNSKQLELDLTARVELSSFVASQERILHDNIPNGYPLEKQTITSNFGFRNHPVTKVKSFHTGVDLRAKIGRHVFSTADGIIHDAGNFPLSGNQIVVQHNFGFETRYSHLDKILVSVGDVISKGDLIGYSGDTGRSVGSHLHYEVRYLGESMNPFPFLEWEFGTREIFTQVRGIKWQSLINLINKQITHRTLQLSQLEHTLSVK